MKTCWRLALAAAMLGATMLVASPAQAEDRSPAPTVCIQPMGKYTKRYLPIVERGIDHVFGFDVRILDPIEMPEGAWYEKRERWRADTILDHLADHPVDGCEMVVGFTREDISTTKGDVKDWGIFGLGEVAGYSAVVSSHRLGRKKTGENDKPIRTVKVVNHEIGHVLGLPHGGEPGCMMNDAEGSIETVDAEVGVLCAPSIERVEARFDVTLPRRDDVEWTWVLEGGEK